jgi:L-asparaginase II
VRLAVGDAERPVFYRSMAKPLQALEAVVSGAADAYGLGPRELALACGSHSADASHVAVARSILAKSGVPEEALQCGGHWSLDPDVAVAQRKTATSPARVLSNCSGKHATMLATSRHNGWPLDSYLAPDHPLQQRIRGHVAAFAGMRPEDVVVAVDGCGAPTFAIPLAAMARSLARLADPKGLPDPVAKAARRLTAAMRAHPEMVGGEGRFDTDLMRSASTPLAAKGGAEALHGVAVLGRPLGVAVKVEDGADRGYRMVVVEVLRRLGALTDAEAEGLWERHGPRRLRNWAGREIGTLEVLLA